MSEETSPRQESNNPEQPDGANEGKSGRDKYNMVSDTVAGVNFRKKDNLYQALYILATIIFGAIIGSLLVVFRSDIEMPWYGGALIGGISGMVIGFISSGFFLMFFRGMRHMKGKHD